MRKLIQRFAVLAVVLSWAHVSSAQTADEVIEKSITAMGGRAAMEKIKNRQTSGTISLTTPVGDLPGTIEVTNAVPNKARTVIKADLTSVGAGPMVIDQRFDGTNGYVLDSLQGDRPISGDQLSNMRTNTFPHPFLSYKANGTTVKMAEKEKVGGRDAFVLLFEPSSGPAVRQYIDAETYLPMQAKIKMTLPQMGELEQTAASSDFRDVDGVKVPFKLQVSSAIQNFTITIDKVQHNIAIDEKLFSKP